MPEKGLMLAVDLDDEEKVRDFISYAFDHGILIDWFLYDAGSLRIAPPLIITEDEILDICEVINQGLDEISK